MLQKNDVLKSTPEYFLVCKGLPDDDAGVTTSTVCQEIRPGDGFETGDCDFVKGKSGEGGATVERLNDRWGGLLNPKIVRRLFS